MWIKVLINLINNLKERCNNCNKTSEYELTYIDVNDTVVCNECYELLNYGTCENCSNVMFRDDMNEFNDDLYCDNCINDVIEANNEKNV